MTANGYRPLLGLFALAVGAQTLPPISSPNSCSIPINPVPTTASSVVVGTGTPASCTEYALESAMRIGGGITFNCGPNAVIVPITTEHIFRTDVNTVLDGGNRITLQGNGSTRIFGARNAYLSSLNSITLQNITIANGRSSGPALPPLPPGAPTTCSQGTELEGGGGAIFVRDMVLHVINSRFVNNHGPSLGPDVAGGAIYAEGSLDVTIVNSTFQSNDASNGGAFGSLQSKVTLVDNVFQSNQAVGHGGNYNIPSSGCPLHLNQYQVGSGGNAGAVYFDGQADPGISVCGNKFRNNNGTDGLGGALWAAGDPGILNITINQSEFDANKNGKGGGVYGYKTKMVIARSTFVNNSAGNGGAVQTDISTFTSVNNTYSGNSASVSVGTLGLFTTTGTVLNSTFSGNKAPYYPIQFTGSTSTAAPNISFVNNIFSGNVSTSYSVQCQSTLPGANNVAWPVPPRSPATETACASDTMFLDPQLGALSDNGGGILTMPIPLANAAARIGTSNCPTADARGVKRGSVCAAGSFEPK